MTDDGRPLVVGHAQEVDVATNELLFDWRCYPAVNPELSYSDPFGDYFHINSIDLWPGQSRNLLVSLRNTSAVFLVDRQTKEVVWRLGGRQSDFTMGPGARFYFQHDARALADGTGLSIFDDASQPCPESAASGKVLVLDQASGSATLLTALSPHRSRVQHAEPGELPVAAERRTRRRVGLLALLQCLCRR